VLIFVVEENPQKILWNEARLNPVITPGPHWWEASCLTAAPSQLFKAEIYAFYSVGLKLLTQVIDI